MFNFGKKIVINSVTSGEFVQLEKVTDEVFAKKMMGEGFAIEPDQDKIYSPIDGKIAMVFPTKHAIGIVNELGVEILIHVGINTVELKGEFFECVVKDGQAVKAGQEILKFDREQIRQKGYPLTTMVIITNTPKYEFHFNDIPSSIKAGDPILRLKAK